MPSQPRRSSSDLRLLFFTRILPGPRVSGSGTYAFELLSYLASHGCKIRVVWTSLSYEQEVRFRNELPAEAAAVFDIQAKNCIRIGRYLYNPNAILLPLKARCLHLIKQIIKPVWSPRKPAASLAYQSAAAAPQTTSTAWDRLCTDDELALLRQHVAAFKPGVILANYSWMLAGATQLSPRLPTWVLTNDYRFRRCILTSDYEFKEVLADDDDHTLEKRLLGTADIILAIQENEAACFRRALPGRRVLTAGMPASAQPAPPAALAPICAFLGSNNIANKKAVEWFMTDVWPLVRQRIPDARFLVGGRVCSDLKMPSTECGIQLLGTVDSVYDFYAGAAVVVAPLLEGSGVKIKLVEAVAHGRACVATSVGIDGVEFFSPFVAVADQPQKFAEATIRFLEDARLRENSASSAREIATHRLHPDICFRAVLDELKPLADTP
jgi:glycosyltransferase involved in cell wall biosynthesis